jgi:hypothetical protein
LRWKQSLSIALMLGLLAIAACAALPSPETRPAKVSRTAMPDAPGIVPGDLAGPSAPTGIPTPVASFSTKASPGEFCSDPQPLQLLERFEAAILNSDGALLASTVSSEHGMDVRLLRNGRVVNYDRRHAEALFESSFGLDWGMAPGSGLPMIGSFRDILLPELRNLLTKDYALSCNQIQVGGATYTPEWPYGAIDFYSLHFAGSTEYGGLDWQTWLLGMQYVGDVPQLYAIMQLKWEP